MKYYFENDGYCVCCDKNVKFIATNSWYRDNYIYMNHHHAKEVLV